MDKLALFNKEQFKENVPKFDVGDMVRVTTKIKEENKLIFHFED